MPTPGSRPPDTARRHDRLCRRCILTPADRDPSMCKGPDCLWLQMQDSEAHDPFFGAVRGIFPDQPPAPLKKKGWLPWFEVLCSWPYRGLTATPGPRGVTVGLVMAGSPEPWGLVSLPCTLTPDAARQFADRLIAAADAVTHPNPEK